MVICRNCGSSNGFMESTYVVLNLPNSQAQTIEEMLLDHFEHEEKDEHNANR